MPVLCPIILIRQRPNRLHIRCQTNLLGTGFVIGPQKHLVTCAHVASAGSGACLYQWVNTNIFRQIHLVYVLPRYDLAVFECDPPTPSGPFPFGDIHRVRPGDFIFYAGRGENALIINRSSISAIGTSLNDGANVDFVEFIGEAVPGYSGGPVLNAKGEVIAIVREAWTKRGLKGGETVRVDRGFSTEILAILHEQVYKEGAAIPHNDSSTDLLNLVR